MDSGVKHLGDERERTVSESGGASVSAGGVQPLLTGGEAGGGGDRDMKFSFMAGVSAFGSKQGELKGL